MTTKEIEASVRVVKELFQGNVPIEEIHVSDNPRRRFDAERLKELAENIRHNGVLVPLLLAKNGQKGYRLIAGERRLRAAKSLGLKEVPARVVEADEKQQEELQVFENLHREDLGAIEEARAFKKLLDAGKHTVEGLAKQVDKSVKYVTRSIRLLELPKAAIQAIEKETITPEHGHQILRVPEDKREKLVEYALTPKWGGVLPTIHEVKQEIERRIEKDLSRASFPKDREFAGAMPCTACPFNTGNQDSLFEGAQDGKCTNGACFTKKTNQFLREFKEQAEKRFPELKCVGIGTADHRGTVKGAVVLSPEESKSEKVKELIEKEPGKFGFAVLKPTAYSSKQAPTVVIVCQDQELLAASIRKERQSRIQGGMTAEQAEKEQFLRSAEDQAVFADAAAKVRAVKKEHIVRVVLALNGLAAAHRAMGIDMAEKLEGQLEKLSEKDLLRLAWLSTVDEWNMDKIFPKFGVQVQKVRKQAREKALPEWEKVLAAKTKAAEQSKQAKA